MHAKHTLALVAIAATAALAAPAYAASSHPYHGFALRHARAVAVATTRGYPDTHVKHCHWRSRHVAICNATIGPLVVVDGTKPVTFGFDFVVTRSELCPLPVHNNTVSGVDTQIPTCYAGPLSATPENLHQTS